jgi:peptidoglycan/xylan/chitin deacetylase (PgdA/CDA1 family)
MTQRQFVYTVTFTTLLLVTYFVQSIKAQNTPVETRPQVAWDGTLRRIHAPILMYHYIGDLPANADNTRINLTVEIDNFRAQMQYLQDNGYTTISLYDLYEALMRGTALPPNPVILTFDDGYLDHYTTAFPILQEYGFIGTFFIITARADNNNPEHLNWQQIRAMSDASMGMESHTKDHVELDERDYDFIVYQVLGSLQSLAYYTEQDPHMFSYPVGRYDDNTVNVIQTLPIWAAVTTEPGTLQTTDHVLEMPRIRINHDTRLPTFAYLLNQ